MSAEKSTGASCKCRLDFTLTDDVETERVYIYYGLDNFYQNYRFLMHTRLYRQMGGDLGDQYVPKFCLTKENKTTIPCGQLANIMFDDEFTLIYSNSSAFPLDRYNIVLKGSRGYVFRNPQNFDGNNYTKPTRWSKDLFSLDQQSNNGMENGPFIVWMTVATFNNFRKLYATIQPPNNRLSKGDYSVDIDYRYGVHSTHGKKTIRIETIGLFGPRNDGLIVALACLSLIYIAIFLFIALVVWRKWADFVLAPGHAP